MTDNNNTYNSSPDEIKEELDSAYVNPYNINPESILSDSEKKYLDYFKQLQEQDLSDKQKSQLDKTVLSGVGRLPESTYYPYYNPTGQISSVSGSIIGTQPIFGNASLYPFGVEDSVLKARQDALAQEQLAELWQPTIQYKHLKDKTKDLLFGKAQTEWHLNKANEYKQKTGSSILGRYAYLNSIEVKEMDAKMDTFKMYTDEYLDLALQIKKDVLEDPVNAKMEYTQPVIDKALKFLKTTDIMAGGDLEKAMSGFNPRDLQGVMSLSVLLNFAENHIVDPENQSDFIKSGISTEKEDLYRSITTEGLEPEQADMIARFYVDNYWKGEYKEKAIKDLSQMFQDKHPKKKTLSTLKMSKFDPNRGSESSKAPAFTFSPNAIQQYGVETYYPDTKEYDPEKTHAHELSLSNVITYRDDLQPINTTSKSLTSSLTSKPLTSEDIVGNILFKPNQEGDAKIYIGKKREPVVINIKSGEEPVKYRIGYGQLIPEDLIIELKNKQTSGKELTEDEKSVLNEQGKRRILFGIATAYDSNGKTKSVSSYMDYSAAKETLNANIKGLEESRNQLLNSNTTQPTTTGRYKNLFVNDEK
jgi:hypothetical protein